MRKSCFAFSFAVVFSLIATVALAQEPKEDPAHDELRALRKKVISAYQSGDLDKLIAHLDKDVIVTWQNGHVTHGHAELKAFFEKMTKGPDRIVEKSTIDPEPERLSLLYNGGTTAIAWGNSKDDYVLTDGTAFKQDTRWSATLVKQDGEWKVVSIHISVNLFDNPILAIAVKKTALWVGIIAAGVGLIVGGGTACFLCRKKATA